VLINKIVVRYNDFKSMADSSSGNLNKRTSRRRLFVKKKQHGSHSKTQDGSEESADKFKGILHKPGKIACVVCII